MPKLKALCRSLDDTAALGRALAAGVLKHNPGALLLQGSLGAGKTALAAALVQALPGGDMAETSSPSFTICNIYYTAPFVRHFDLYRLPPGLPNDELAEALDETGAINEALTIVEWPERMDKADAPSDGVLCRISLCPHKGDAPQTEARLFEFAPLGPAGALFLDAVSRLHSFQQG